MGIFEQENIIPDKVIVFTTEEAYKENWLDSSNNRHGLASALKGYSVRAGAEISCRSIPDGQNEKELWEIFRIILDSLEEGEEIILDITHSFRYLPMLTFIVLNYARAVKNCIRKT